LALLDMLDDMARIGGDLMRLEGIFAVPGREALAGDGP
jgi:hypothetical protein